MVIPERIPGLKALNFLVGLYGVVWIALEGDLLRVLLLAVGVAAVALGYGARHLRGRRFSRPGWLLLAAVAGLLLGSGSGLLALLLMGVKTGLHAHGPEFAAAELTWVLARLPWWGAGGFLAGLGMGMVGLALSPKRQA